MTNDIRCFVLDHIDDKKKVGFDYFVTGVSGDKAVIDIDGRPISYVSTDGKVKLHISNYEDREYLAHRVDLLLGCKADRRSVA